MADGDYERRGGREAELKKFARLMSEARSHEVEKKVSSEKDENSVLHK